MHGESQQTASRECETARFGDQVARASHVASAGGIEAVRDVFIVVIRPAAVGLAIVLSFYRLKQSVFSDEADQLRH